LVAELPLDATFSGVPLPLPAPKELRLPPEQWPEDQTFWDGRWEDLEARFTGG
jgi:hypothetical protein